MNVTSYPFTWRVKSSCFVEFKLNMNIIFLNIFETLFKQYIFETLLLLLLLLFLLLLLKLKMGVGIQLI